MQATNTLAEDKRALEKRLRCARFYQSAEMRKLFERARFEYRNRRIVAPGFALQESGGLIELVAL